VALSATIAAILEGKQAQWREFIREMSEGGSQHAAYVASRQAIGVRERAFLQPDADGRHAHPDRVASDRRSPSSAWPPPASVGRNRTFLRLST
jgi:hypothetical protein